MGRSHRHRGGLRAAAGSGFRRVPSRLFLTSAERSVLLAGTALVSTLFAAAPTPASAQVAVFRPLSLFPVTVTNNKDCTFPGTCALISTIFPGASIDFTNRGNFATVGIGAVGITTNTIFPFSSIRIQNSGDIATAGFAAIGIQAGTLLGASPIQITNSGDIATAGFAAIGISGYTGGRSSSISITNSGSVLTGARFAHGIAGYTYGRNSDLSIVNTGDIETRGILSHGISGVTLGRNASLTIHNSGSVNASGASAFGIMGVTVGNSAPLTIENSGDVSGSTAGIYTHSGTSTTIANSGSISAKSGLAIDTNGASTTIQNSGLITGFVDLTDSRDVFLNQAGGKFVATDTSNFGGGDDLFSNANGGTLRTATKYANGELTSFVGLKRFENQGLITMQDGRDNDVFRISNTPGGKDLTFVGSGNSTLAVDAFLGGPGSPSDLFIIDGNAEGRTKIAVLNTNQGGGRYNPVAIPVVFINGKTDGTEFYIDQPIDAGFFDYDLFFKPTGSGFFELKSAPGGGAHVLPHLVTASHDVFHATSETWFDQSTDLRALLATGDLCDPQALPGGGTRCVGRVAPAIWARGAGTWLDQDDSATTNANGRTYRHTLDRKLEVMNFETGIDFGKRELFTPGDILVFGILGGAVQAALDYKSLVRQFDLSSGEVGAYATYLRGGLFVDTLAKAHFLTLDPREVRGFPDTLHGQTYGVRTDAGYRFGGMRYGPFIEPLATIAASWSHVDDFALDGNAVDFGDDEDVRGRVGMRLGTSTDIWEGTTMEPFVVGSLWGTLSGDHHATLTSTGTTFEFTDEPEDLWGVVSAGVNFFNPGAQTTVFAKVDYTFADQTQGVGVKGGMRYNW